MTYAAYEDSVANGAPTELYEFTYQTRALRYCNGVDTQTFAVQPYAPAAISRTSLSDSQDANRANVTIKVPRTLEITQIFISQPPSDVVSVTIRRRHVGDDQFLVIWKGRVLSASWEGNWVSLTCESALTSVKRIGLRRMYQKGCPHELYGAKCGANAGVARIDSNSFSVTPNSRIINVQEVIGIAEGYFAGGYIEYQHADTGNPEYRYIRTNDDLGNLYLVVPPLGLSTGSAYLYVYPGCKHTVADCKDKFDNLDNYGGQPYIPTENPFNGTTIY